MAHLATALSGPVSADGFWGGFGLRKLFKQVRPSQNFGACSSQCLQCQPQSSRPCTAVASFTPSSSSSSLPQRPAPGSLSPARAGGGAMLALDEPFTIVTDEVATGRAAAAEAVALARAAAVAAKQAAALAERGDLSILEEFQWLSDADFRSSSSMRPRASSQRAPAVAPLEWQRILGQSSVLNSPDATFSYRKQEQASLQKRRTGSPAASILEASTRSSVDEAKVTNQITLVQQPRILVQSSKKGKRGPAQRKSTKAAVAAAAAAKAKGLLVENSSEAKARLASVQAGGSLKELMNASPGSTVLLTAEEEIALTTEVQKLLKLENQEQELKEALGRDPTKEEWAAAVGLNTGKLEDALWKGRQSKQRMLSCNIGLVISIARKYSTWGLSLEEIITRGTGGLIKAMEKFDYRRGFKFSTYAHWWVRQSIGRSVTEQSRTVRMPPHVYELMSRITKAKDMLVRELGRTPADDEVAELVGMTAARMRKVLKSAKPMVSMDKPTALDGEQTLGSFVASPIDESHEVEIERKLLNKDLQNALHTLLPREREVLKMRYGLVDGRARTLEEVGATFRVTRERIRQLEHRALRKLRQPERSSVLQEYVE